MWKLTLFSGALYALAVGVSKEFLTKSATLRLSQLQETRTRTIIYMLYGNRRRPVWIPF